MKMSDRRGASQPRRSAWIAIACLLLLLAAGVGVLVAIRATPGHAPEGDAAISATERTADARRPGPDGEAIPAMAASAPSIPLFKRKVRTLSDPEWNMALVRWAEGHPEFAPWLHDGRARLEAASRTALQQAPDATFEELMPGVAARMRTPVAAGTVVVPEATPDLAPLGEAQP